MISQREKCLGIIRNLSALTEQPTDELGEFFNSELERVFTPFADMASTARQWFTEEAERQIERDELEAVWRKKHLEEEKIATEARREQNKKDAEA